MRCRDYEDETEMFELMRKRNLIESGKYDEEEVENHKEEWMSPRNLQREVIDVKNKDCSNS